jgi:hypothetical protein
MTDQQQEQTGQTYLDQEIAELEKALPRLEAEKERLQAGFVEIKAFGEGQHVEVDLSQIVAIEDEQERAARVRELMSDSPIFTNLTKAFKNQHQVRADMVAAGILPSAALNLAPKAKAKLAGHRIGQQVERAGSGGGLGRVRKFFNSPWILAIGLLLILIWGGGWLLYATTGKTIGGPRPVNSKTATASASSPGPTNRLNVTTRSATALASTPKPSQAGQSLAQAQVGYTYSYQPDQGQPVLTSTTTSQATTEEGQGQAEATTTPAPQATAQPSVTTDSNYTRVGQPPTDTGGLNGPHGSFLAPSRLTMTALGVDVTIQKAIVEEHPIMATTPPATTTNQAQTTTTEGQRQGQPTMSQTDPTPQVGVSIVWPRPGEVLHYGAYPGEIGNCLLFGTQEGLAQLRYLQQNDEIKLYDRNKNVFVYRVVAFSPTGQPERIVNPNAQTDNWIFGPGTNNEALLTIIVSYPQPLPPVNPATNPGSAQSGQGGSTSQSQPGAGAKDDFTTAKKLAYRAVLVGFAPNAQATPNSTPVAVAGGVWQTQPMPALHADETIITPAAGPVPTPTETSGLSIIELLKNCARRIAETANERR